MVFKTATVRCYAPELTVMAGRFSMATVDEIHLVPNPGGAARSKCYHRLFCIGFWGFVCFPISQWPPYFNALSQLPSCRGHSYPLCLQHVPEKSINAAGSTSHSPSVISALLVRTFPSINLITAKTVQRIPLKTETLYRKSS